VSKWVLFGLLIAGALGITAAAYWPSDSDLGGSTGDNIAERIERECGESVRDRARPDDFQAPAFSRQGIDLIYITCPSGYVNPYAELTQFESGADLERAYETSGPKARRAQYCIAGNEAISGDFSGFYGLCNELGGHFR
jgi:hypothetical protein